MLKLIMTWTSLNNYLLLPVTRACNKTRIRLKPSVGGLVATLVSKLWAAITNRPHQQQKLGNPSGVSV